MKRRATQVVAQGADPAAEHARLAMALGYSGVMPGTAAPPSSTPLGTQPAAYPGLHSATPAAAPPAAHGAMTEADVKRIVAAAVKGNAPPTGGGGDADSRRKLKAEERKRRGRLPEGKRCKSGTCDLNHDEKYPGRPCYSDPRVAISVPHTVALELLNGSRSGVLLRANALGLRPSPSLCCPLARRLRARLVQALRALMGSMIGGGLALPRWAQRLACIRSWGHRRLSRGRPCSSRWRSSTPWITSAMSALMVMMSLWTAARQRVTLARWLLRPQTRSGSRHRRRHRRRHSAGG